MASLSSLLPAPARAYEVFSDAAERPEQPRPSASRPVPPYGQRAGFTPKSQADFGGGGAYPEIHVAQFPLDMGRPAGGRVGSGASGGSSAIVPVSVDAATGAARFDAIVQAQHRGKVAVHSQFSELVEKRPEDVVRLRPSAEEEAAVAERTAAALTGIVAHKLSNARTSVVDASAQSRADQARYIRYTPAEDAPGYTAATSQRIIKMVDASVDPLEPPKFKAKKVPGGPPDAPVPVMHSPPRKATAEDQAAWKIPPAISNWKNPHGYIIPLDKRLAADGRSLLEPVINDNFAKLSEALLIAERKARVEVETRAAIQKRLAVKEKEAREAELRALAAKARMERSGIAALDGAAAAAVAGSSSSSAAAAGAPPAAAAGWGDGGEAAAPSHRRGGDREPQLGGDYDSDDGAGGGAGAGGGGGGFITGGRGAAEAEEDFAAARERDRLRAERKRERERELRSEAAGKKSRLARDDDRDVSERIALGMPVGAGTAGAGGGSEALYDSRLFNQTEGMQSGFGAEDDYAVYSAPWRADGAAASAAASYRPRAGLGADGGYNAASADEQLRKLADAGKFGAGGGTDFEGVSKGGAGGRTAGAPVQFERAAAGTAGASASGTAAATAGGAPPAADPFGLDQFLSASSSAGARGGGSALDRVGQRGFMAAAGGSAARSAEEYAGGSGRDRIDFRSSGTTR